MAITFPLSAGAAINEKCGSISYTLDPSTSNFTEVENIISINSGSRQLEVYSTNNQYGDTTYSIIIKMESTNDTTVPSDSLT